MIEPCRTTGTTWIAMRWVDHICSILCIDSRYWNYWNIPATYHLVTTIPKSWAICMSDQIFTQEAMKRATNRCDVSIRFYTQISLFIGEIPVIFIGNIYLYKSDLKTTSESLVEDSPEWEIVGKLDHLFLSRMMISFIALNDDIINSTINASRITEISQWWSR